MPPPTADGAAHSAHSLLRCPACAAALDYDQRYCVDCGAPCRTAPPAVAALLASIAAQTPDTGARAPAATTAAGAAEDPSQGNGAEDSQPQQRPPWRSGGIRLSRPAMATAVMALLAFGVLVGSSITPTPQSASDSPILIAAAPPPSS